MAETAHHMDPGEVRRLLTELQRRLEEAGIDAQIHVFGGSAMALNFPDDPETRMTQDIDATIVPRAGVQRVVDEMARDLNLSPTWLNHSGGGWVPPRQTNAGTGVQITTADAHELIAMKLAASRHQDLFDLGVLARHANITDANELVDIAYRLYGDDSLALTDSREDYRIMAEQALRHELKRRAKK